MKSVHTSTIAQTLADDKRTSSVSEFRACYHVLPVSTVVPASLHLLHSPRPAQRPAQLVHLVSTLLSRVASVLNTTLLKTLYKCELELLVTGLFFDVRWSWTWSMLKKWNEVGWGRVNSWPWWQRAVCVLLPGLIITSARGERVHTWWRGCSKAPWEKSLLQ